MAEQVSSVNPLVEIVVPVYNEERDLRSSIERLRSFLDVSIPFACVITIVDNASTDGSWRLASDLSQELVGVNALHLDQKGRGRALRAAWTATRADVVAYMDVDLSTGLNALLPLLAPIVSGHSDVAIGTRLAPGSRVVRGPKRELISRAYNMLLRLLLGNSFSDAQCGFKAFRAEEVRALLPAVVDEEWFFDTELLVLAERNGLRIHEVPVDWNDDPDSRVHVLSTALADLRGVWRMLGVFSRPRGCTDSVRSTNRKDDPQLTRFTRVGVVSTVLYIVICLALARRWDIYLANTAALLVCTIGGELIHTRFSYRDDGEPYQERLLGAAMAVAASLLCTTLALDVSTVMERGSDVMWAAALLAGTLVSAVLRLAMFKSLIFRSYLDSRSRAASTTRTASPDLAPTEIEPEASTPDAVDDGSPRSVRGLVA